MKKMNAAALITVANAVIPDGEGLAIFNLLAEIHNSKLLTELADGDPAVIARADCSVSAAIAFVILGTHPIPLAIAFNTRHDHDRLLPDLIDRIRAFQVPAGQAGPQLSFFSIPRTVAALISCETRSGARACQLCHHPSLTAEEARILLKVMVETLGDPGEPPEAPPEPDPEPDVSKN